MYLEICVIMKGSNSFVNVKNCCLCLPTRQVEKVRTKQSKELLKYEIHIFVNIHSLIGYL